MTDEQKKEPFLDRLKKLTEVLGNVPKAAAGLLLILSLLGGTYSSFFKVEKDARETYSVLAPDVELALNQSDDNAVELETLRREVAVLKKSNDILQGLLIGVITAHSTGGEETLTLEVDKIVAPPPEPKREPEPPAKPKRPAGVHRREKQLPYWEQQKAE